MRDALSSGTSNGYSTRASFCICSNDYKPLVGVAASFIRLIMGEQHNRIPPRLHIGNLIKEELERQERTVSWFARKLCCDRSNIYKLFKRSTIDTELLLRVSKILNYDFFELYKKEL